MTGGPPLKTAIYSGSIFHRRIRPKAHRFRYGVYSVLFDLSELDHLNQKITGFGYNRPAPFAFYDKDHGPRDGSNLVQWGLNMLAAHRIHLNNPSFRVLCFPRVFGVTFNPISTWFCYETKDENEQLSAIIYEVHNTFGSEHSYVVKITPSEQDLLAHSRKKAFHVSPFFDTKGHYDFRLKPIGECYHLNIRYYNDARKLRLVADHQAKYMPFTTLNLWSMFWRKPLVTTKVIMGIHWEALHLYARKSAKLYPDNKP